MESNYRCGYCRRCVNREWHKRLLRLLTYLTLREEVFPILRIVAGTKPGEMVEGKQTKLAPVRVVGKGRRISIGAGEFSPIVGVKAVR